MICATRGNAQPICFPMKLKSHSSHDIVLLCGSCHMRTCSEYDVFRSELAAEIGVNLQPTMVLSRQQQSLRKLKSAAMALMRSPTKMPAARHAELMREMKGHFGHDASLAEIEALASVDEVKSSHGWRVVERYRQSKGGIESLARRWREFFLRAMQPQHLSPFWETDHQKPNDLGAYDADEAIQHKAQAQAQAQAKADAAALRATKAKAQIEKFKSVLNPSAPTAPATLTGAAAAAVADAAANAGAAAVSPAAPAPVAAKRTNARADERLANIS
jgi:hypothetical protein